MTVEEEIKNISKLMKIRIIDHREYIEKVQNMLDFFNMLDSAGVEEEEIPKNTKLISQLREDKHVTFDEELLENLKEFRDGYIRAPKMN